MFVCKKHLTNYIHGTFVCTNMAYPHFDWWLYDKKHQKHSKEVVPTSRMLFFIYRHILWLVLGYALGTVLHEVSRLRDTSTFLNSTVLQRISWNNFVY
jgi:hypothetical protein